MDGYLHSRVTEDIFNRNKYDLDIDELSHIFDVFSKDNDNNNNNKITLHIYNEEIIGFGHNLLIYYVNSMEKKDTNIKKILKITDSNDYTTIEIQYEPYIINNILKKIALKDEKKNEDDFNKLYPVYKNYVYKSKLYNLIKIEFIY